MAISYEIYETRKRLVSYISCEMTTRVRSSICKMTENYDRMRIGTEIFQISKTVLSFIFTGFIGRFCE